jgi:hypothetical protein
VLSDGNINHGMKALTTNAMLVLLTVAALGVALGACGATSKEKRSASSTDPIATTTTGLYVTSGGYLKADGDIDSDDEKHTGKRPDDYDDRPLLADYPDKPSRATRQAITAVVKSYYAAAAAEDGTRACAVLDASLLIGLSESTSQPRENSGNGCVTSVDRLFKQEHAQLTADEVATMVVTSVHVKGEFGVALLGFRKALEGEILVEREGHMWKIGALSASQVP